MNYLKLKDGEKLFYRDQGTGAPVILIHGWPVNADMWEYQVAALVEGDHRVISFDRRGFGRSSQPAFGYDYDTLANDLRELISHLELQNCALVGFSMGGGEIARYLSLFGTERITKVALIGSITPFLLKADDNRLGVEDEVFYRMIKALRDDRPHFLASFAKDFYGGSLFNSSVSDEILHWTLQMALPASPMATIECVSSFSETDFRPDMKFFSLPTLIIHGTADKIVPLAIAEEGAKMIPRARFVKYEGAPHGLFVTHKKQLAEDLYHFLNQDFEIRPEAREESLGIN